MGLYRLQVFIAFILIFFTIIVTGLEDDITVVNADCCSEVRSSRNMGVYGSRCPTKELDVACGPQGCCVSTNQTMENTVAASYQPYPCIFSDDVIEPWNVCNGFNDCPLGDDEMYCSMYVCASIFEEPSSSIAAPCPSSDTCYQPSGSCLSSQLCPNETTTVDLCVDPCPASCLCDALAMICIGDIEQGAEDEPLINNSRILQFALVDFTGDLYIRNVSHSFNDGNYIDLKPSEISYVNTLVITAPQPMTLEPGFYLEIEDGAFSYNSYLRTLVLKGSALEFITNSTFEGLSSLEYLNLDNNYIPKISSNSFASLKALKTLSMAYNIITVIEPGAFDGLENLRSLNLDENPIVEIGAGAFYHLIQLRILFITDVNGVEDFSAENFEGLEGLESMHVTDFRLCCRVANLGKCVDYEPVRFSSCSGLLEYPALGVFMWILGACAFFGNAFVLVMRLRSRGDQKRRRRTAQIQSILILNLATADLLTGLYMLTLAAADTGFGGDYFIYAASWRDGIPCKIIGVIAVLSGEASVLILALISIDRLLVIVFPFGRVHLSLASVKIWAAIIWIFSSIVAILPPIITSALNKDNVGYFYIYSDVCLGLPLVRSTSVELNVEGYDYETQDIDYTFTYTADGKYAYFAIIIFIGLNLLCFLAIFLSYVAIFVYARKTARKARRSPEREQELRLAARMALIVGTDFCCWMPIIILGILTQTGAVTVSTEMYAWCVVFIIPINSAVNPFLYTFGDTCTKKSGGQTSTGSTPVVSKSDHGSKS